MRIAIHWFRRDLRLADNTALREAMAEFDEVIPVFIIDHEWVKSNDMGAPRVAFLLEAIRSLAKDIAAAGGKLLVRQGDSAKELVALVKETKAQAVHFNADHEPDAIKRDQKIEKVLQEIGVKVYTRKDDVILEPTKVLNGADKPYKVFTAYAKKWRSLLCPLPKKRAKNAQFVTKKAYSSGAIPLLEKLGFALEIPVMPAGETEALKQLKAFLRTKAAGYARNRDFPAREGTSHLSPQLSFGTLSPRMVLAAVRKCASDHPSARADLDVFVNELIWRDFYRQILYHFPHVAKGAFRPQYDALKWENNEKHFAAWCAGRTGYPIVDAGMRQLNATGWMHNRVRMIVATFLTKDLLVSWQWGERYFMQKLFDGDLANNNGGWQWCAGTGTDAQPYFRIFNPTAQAVKFDPEGEYIHRWVPEVDTRDYPAPIVDHAKQRVKTLAMYARARG